MLRRVLAVIFEGVSVLTALLFLFGWAYYWAFLESVQLDLPVLDLPLWSFLIEGSTMALLAFGTVLERLNRALWAIVAVGLLLLVVMLLLRWRAPSKVTALRTNHFPRIADFLRRKKQEWRFLHTGIKTFIVALLTFVTVLGFLVGGLNLAVKSGRSEYRRLVDHPSETVQLFFKPGEDQNLPKELLTANTSKRLISLVQTKELIVVLVRNDAHPSAFVIARSDLQAVKVTPEPQSEKAREKLHLTSNP